MPGLLRGVARTAVVAGTATAVSGRVGRRQQRNFAAKDAQAAQDEQMAPAPAEVTDDQFAQLDKLAELKDKGILTQSEFDQKKQQILGL
jgi:membrane protease subunit (stomatin/prohibitin family)